MGVWFWYEFMPLRPSVFWFKWVLLVSFGNWAALLFSVSLIFRFWILIGPGFNTGYDEEESASLVSTWEASCPEAYSTKFLLKAMLKTLSWCTISVLWGLTLAERLVALATIVVYSEPMKFMAWWLVRCVGATSYCWTWTPVETPYLVKFLPVSLFLTLK